ncbi:inositol monophosphatase [Candidatus Nomurabacteria bacterium]|nr:inositol monophosphatase [Candidatus Nomurabacteria bacterium]
MQDNFSKSKELEIAIKAALEAGKILEKYFETEVLKEFKEDKSIVTVADKESEEVIKKIILETFPMHSILGEETGHTNNGHKYTWHIDPLDGTKNLSNGIPLFAISIALERKNELLVGVVYNPVNKSLFYAEKEKGAYLNDKRIYVSKDDVHHSIISGGKSRKYEDRKICRRLMHDLPEMFTGMTIRDFGSAALDLAYVARGGLEATIQIGLHLHDFAAGALLVQEAGGRITGLDGEEWKFPQNYFIASNGVSHDLLVGEIKKQKTKLGV